MTLDPSTELARLKRRIGNASITLTDALPYCKTNLILWAAVLRALTELGATMPDLNDAAERVKQGIFCVKDIHENVRVAERDYDALKLLADAYLSQLAERDETAIDEAWLRSIGGKESERGSLHTPFYFRQVEVHRPTKDRKSWLVTLGLFREERPMPPTLAYVTTRGQLLRLLSALNLTTDAGAM